MTDIITATDVTIEPTQINNYSSAREARNRLHPILGSQETDVTLRPAGRRTGKLELLFGEPTSESDSHTAENALAVGGVFALTSTEYSTIAMSFTVTGTIMRELDTETRSMWTVSFDYQEVSS